MPGSAAIEARGLRKTYGRTVAVDDVSFEVSYGEIFGLIGPNGAGKTTTMECVEGVRRPDAGSVTVLGLDPVRDAYRLQERIGVQLQEAQLQKRVTVGEAVRLWAALYRSTVDTDALLDQLGLAGKRRAWFMTLSGGQKQRLFIALALVHDPQLVFLDELTTGLDPQARRTIWDLVRGIQARGKTVCLTTHLMEEAERLCDRVAIVDHGRIIDVGTPDALVRRHCPERTVVLRTNDPRAAALVRAVPGVDAVDEVNGVDENEGREVGAADASSQELHVRGRTEDLMTGVMWCLADHRIRVTGFRTIVPTLEDVFLRLTGRAIRS